EPESGIGGPALRFGRAGIGQKDALRTAFDNARCDAAARNVGEALGREDDRDVALAQDLEPLANARGEERVVEEDPGLVEDEERGPAVETRLEPVEQIGQY